MYDSLILGAQDRHLYGAAPETGAGGRQIYGLRLGMKVKRDKRDLKIHGGCINATRLYPVSS